jgi:hypothetical protein
MTHTQLWISLLLNAFVFVSVFGSVGAFFVRGGKGNMQRVGRKALVYFTVQSNLFCALVCLALCVWEGLALGRGGEALVPRWLDLLKFTGAAAVGLTFFTVILYLLPVTHFDFRLMYAGRNLLLHALCPLAAMAGWAFVERGEPMAFPWALLGLVPTALYGALYLYKVLLRREWEDFYRFNAGGKWPISIAFMLLLTFLISAGLWALRL